MSLNDVISRFNTGTYDVTRVEQATYDSNGRKIPGGTSVLQIAASVQPAGRRLKAVPEGFYAEDQRVIYTKEVLIAYSPDNAGDQLAIDGETYEVFHASRHGVISGGHTVAHAARKKTP